MKIICPNCNIGLPTKLCGDVRMAYCSKCGFEMAIDREDSTTSLFRPPPQREGSADPNPLPLKLSQAHNHLFL